jgi:hypothetical protein
MTRFTNPAWTLPPFQITTQNLKIWSLLEIKFKNSQIITNNFCL